MYCSNCGTQYPDGGYCPKCNPAYVVPQQAPTYYKKPKNEAIRAWFAPVYIVIAFILGALSSTPSIALPAIAGQTDTQIESYVYTFANSITGFFSSLFGYGVLIGLAALAFLKYEKKKENALPLVFVIPLVVNCAFNALSNIIVRICTNYMVKSPTESGDRVDYVKTVGIIGLVVAIVFFIISIVVSFFATYSYIKKKTSPISQAVIQPVLPSGEVKNEAYRAWFAPVAIIVSAVIDHLLKLLSNHFSSLYNNTSKISFWVLSLIFTTLITFIEIAVFYGFSSIAFLGFQKKKEKAFGLIFAIPLTSYYIATIFDNFAKNISYYITLKNNKPLTGYTTFSYISLTVFTVIAAVVSFFITSGYIKKKTTK